MKLFSKNILFICRGSIYAFWPRRVICNSFASIFGIQAASNSSNSYGLPFFGAHSFSSIFTKAIFSYFAYCFFLLAFGGLFNNKLFLQKKAKEASSFCLPWCFSSSALSAQSLWKDKNPYEPSMELPAGSILKLEVDEPIIIEYEYEDLRDRTKTLKLVPDKNLTKELPPVNTNHSIVNKNKSRLKSKSRVKFRIAVTVQETSNKNVIEFRGLKFISQEGGKQRQQVQVTGRIAISDIKSGRRIRSSDVANLVIQITGAPVRVQEKIPMKYDDKGNPSAQLSDAEKQRLLLDYLNRVLGESKP